MSKPTLYLHIGTPKTASTSIQRSLVGNKEFVEGKGIFIGRGQSRSRVTYKILNKFKTHFQVAATQDFYPVRVLVEEDINAFCEGRYSGMLYSNEDLFEEGHYYNYDKMWEWIKNVYDQFEIKIICYLRRQDFYVESYFGQLIKQRVCPNQFSETLYRMPSDWEGSVSYDSKRDDKMTPFDYFLINFLPFTKYNNIIKKYADIFGKENIIIRPFEKCQLPNGVIYDFYANALNFSEKDISMLKTSDTVNQSFSRDVLEFISASGISERALFSYIDTLLGYNNKNNVYFSNEERKSFMALHEKGNSTLAREYLGREDGKLFYEEIKEYEPYPGLSLEKAFEIREKIISLLEVKRGIYNLNSKYRDELNRRAVPSEVIESTRKIYFRTMDKPLVQELIRCLFDNIKGSDRPVVIYGVSGKLAEWILDEAILYLKCINLYVADRRLGDLGLCHKFSVIGYKYINELNPSAIIIVAAASGKEIRTALEKLMLKDTIIYPAYDFSDKAWWKYTAPLTTPDGYVNPYLEERRDED